MKLKIIFLDFDGVLHPSTCNKDMLFCQAHLLEDIISKNPYEFVISSSWRHQFNLKELKTKLPMISNKISGCTGAPIIGKFARYQEICNYLGTRSKSDWIALDDSTWEFPENCQQLIACNPNTGIKHPQLRRLEAWLNE